MTQVTIVKPLVPLWRRWSVRAQLAFIALNAGVVAFWEYLLAYPDTMEWLGLATDPSVVSSVTHIIRLGTAINIGVGAATIALAAARQKQAGPPAPSP